MAKSFVSNIIIDLSYYLNKYIQYKHVWKLFEVGCLHQHTVIALNRLDRNRKLLKFLHILITTVLLLGYAKMDQNWIPKTTYCVSCSMVCKIIFCSEFLNIPRQAGRFTRRRRQAIIKCFVFHELQGVLCFHANPIRE